MKSFVAMVFFLTSILAFSGEIQVSNKSVYLGSYFEGGSFAINEDLGRAWVELTFTDSDPDSLGEIERVLVKGMSYDKTTEEVILVDNTGRTVCAYLKRGLFGSKSIRPTENCTFVKALYMTTYDNGFEVVNRERQKVTLAY